MEVVDGRKEKENHIPNWTERFSSANQLCSRADEQVADYAQQQDDLTMPKGRSRTYPECTHLLTLVLGIILH